MKTPTRLVRIFLLAGGIGVGLLAAGPASAQYQCPYGYYYYPAWGCVAGSPYGPYGYYPGFDGFFFFDGFRGRRFDHDDFHHHEGFHDHDGFHGHEGFHGHGGHR